MDHKRITLPALQTKACDSCKIQEEKSLNTNCMLSKCLDRGQLQSVRHPRISDTMKSQAALPWSKLNPGSRFNQ